VNLRPGLDVPGFLVERKRARPKAELRSVLAEVLPQRLAQALAATVDTASAQPGRADAVLPRATRMAELPDLVLHAFASRLSAWTVTPSGSEGYAKAEVTRGGVDTRDLSSRTMQANDVPGCSSSAKQLTLPAGSAATTFSGHGRAAGAQAKPLECAGAGKLRRRTTARPRVRQHGVRPLTGHRSSPRHSCCTVFVKRLAGNIGDRQIPGNVRLVF
jgi:hypothetical protein